MQKLLRRFARDDRGATAIEYGLLAALIGVAVISSFLVLGNTVTGLFSFGNASEVLEEGAQRIE